ncbi:hypothetical protein BCR33DRAFT_768199 [Rhizoclosmatium globosum]|uniref:LicD/FKTN/FKRP nucleotidyltransferase domain-containing protein n=1 Tax=Rhizoclosmatium globosum TaxID=329046 RepID=A0A1Y2BZY6_9FUNG|nr:hypothetical protein BCR33DRAFT_768199 [Rhizoclosmatium globosum]|eukprot:ORY40224.1 hypothetical protein BCR33DRAFT_768199 [Rhizoclosmatium globosum]
MLSSKKALTPGPPSLGKKQSSSQLRVTRRWLRLVTLATICSLCYGIMSLCQQLIAPPIPPNPELAKSFDGSLHPSSPLPPVIDLRPPKPATTSPIYLSFNATQVEPLHRFSIPATFDLEEAKKFKQQYYELTPPNNNQQKIRLDYPREQARFSKLDTGNYIMIPNSHFALTQPLPPFGASSTPNNTHELFEIAKADKKYFWECAKDKKLDHRFVDQKYCKVVNGSMPVLNHNLTAVHESLVDMLRAWSTFARERELVWWISHGELIGFFWSGKMLPWDTDLDIQMPISQLIQLVHWNGTLIGNRFLIDVNPAFLSRRPSRENVIDARIIDSMTGTIIDITALTEVEGKDGVVSCKSPHHYHIAELIPLVETVLEGIVVWRPRAVISILKEEYGAKSMVHSRFLKYGVGAFRFDFRHHKWVSLRAERKEAYGSERIVLGILLLTMISFSAFVVYMIVSS